MTEQRGALERALRNARKLAKECGQLEEWLGGTEAELDQREAAVPTQNLQAEVDFVQVGGWVDELGVVDCRGG